MAVRRKYGNRKVVVDGMTFDSAKEANRYSDLKLLQKSGDIAELETQPFWDIAINGMKICRYRADFRYLEDGERVVEDVKTDQIIVRRT